MKLHITTDDVKLTDDVKKAIDLKLDKPLDKYLQSIDEDSRKANLILVKGVNWGFSVRFDMTLPGGHEIHVNQKHKELPYAIKALGNEVKRSLRKYKEKEEAKAK